MSLEPSFAAGYRRFLNVTTSVLEQTTCLEMYIGFIHTSLSQQKILDRIRVPGLRGATGLLLLSRGTLVGLWSNTAATFPLARRYTLLLHPTPLLLLSPSKIYIKHTQRSNSQYQDVT